jgi:hypothetical protein
MLPCVCVWLIWSCGICWAKIESDNFSPQWLLVFFLSFGSFFDFLFPFFLGVPGSPSWEVIS